MDIMSKTSDGKIVEIDNGGYRYERPVSEIGVNGFLWPIDSMKTIRGLMGDCGYALGDDHMWTANGPETVQESLVDLLTDKNGERKAMEWMDALDSKIDEHDWDDANKDQSAYSVDDVTSSAGMETMIRSCCADFVRRNGLGDVVAGFKDDHGDLDSILRCDSDWCSAAVANLRSVKGIDGSVVDGADEMLTDSARFRLMVKTYSCWRMYGECSVVIKHGGRGSSTVDRGRASE